MCGKDYGERKGGAMSRSYTRCYFLVALEQRKNGDEWDDGIDKE